MINYHLIKLEKFTKFILTIKMTIDIAYIYCTKLSEQEKIEIDKEVKKNRFELKYIILFLCLRSPIYSTLRDSSFIFSSW